MNSIFFTISDWLRVWHNNRWHKIEVPSRDKLDQIFQNHLIPINSVRNQIRTPLRVHRGYASVEWEKARGRDGTSQHCFPEHDFGDKLGATDIDCWYEKDATKGFYLSLANALANTSYKRIAWYPEGTFFHNDYKAAQRQYFIYNPERKIWVYQGANKRDWIDKIGETFEET